jgi:hypothetical protein|tara:strand:+ start:636 stop:1115 length:480 start_codon:yes stop_codon:yes gene_type:complete
MGNVNSFLADWTIRFLENKDAIKGEIVKIEKDKGGFDFVINYKDKVKCFIIAPILDNNASGRIKNEGHFGVVTLNNPSNIRSVINEWKKLADFEFLNIYFVNPFSSADKAWVINPYIHDKVCDKASLELGLKAMAEMVNIIGMDEMNKKVKLLKEESGQ